MDSFTRYAWHAFVTHAVEYMNGLGKQKAPNGGIFLSKINNSMVLNSSAKTSLLLRPSERVFSLNYSTPSSYLSLTEFVLNLTWFV